jgi:hypothetical protein
MIKYYAMAGAGVALFAAGWFVNGALWESKWDAHMLADSQANEKAATEALTKQQNLIKELDHVRQASIQIKEKHDRNVSDSRIAADRLRSELNRIKALPAITHTSTIALRANAATDRLVLAELLGESDERAGAYGAEADKLRIALGQCNSEYEAVRLTVGN